MRCVVESPKYKKVSSSTDFLLSKLSPRDEQSKKRCFEKFYKILSKPPVQENSVAVVFFKFYRIFKNTYFVEQLQTAAWVID